ncbi:unnamed protein product [Anisakis simplex]|uniref:RRM domain-containing protein n=1 Tax=Anisakis simplex TaxID=6269 RepID=A0A0M3JUS7_ANISI|nr:unnamed protein product [Anisakis simplex]
MYHLQSIHVPVGTCAFSDFSYMESTEDNCFDNLDLIFVFSVGNIPYNCSEMDVGNFFSRAGTVLNVRLVYDRETGRSKGFGFCDFMDEASAQGAINTLNGADFNGRTLRVNWANK